MTHEEELARFVRGEAPLSDAALEREMLILRTDPSKIVQSSCSLRILQSAKRLRDLLREVHREIGRDMDPQSGSGFRLSSYLREQVERATEGG